MTSFMLYSNTPLHASVFWALRAWIMHYPLTFCWNSTF